jgi:DsbC/DsbD-like thiol-disulfide interchange protein
MIKSSNRVGFGRIQFTLLFGTALCAVSSAQVSNETVQWTASVISTSPVKHGSNATLELSAEVREGWHVYALTQPTGGPTALRITLDQNEVAQVAGAPSGTAPERKHDPSFDLETESYTHAFALRLPVYVKRSAGGAQLLPISVRFQACSDRECLPPRTVHLSVPVEAPPKVMAE